MMELPIPREIQVQVTIDFLEGMDYNSLVKKYGVSRYTVINAVKNTFRAASIHIGETKLTGFQWKSSARVARYDKEIWKAAIEQTNALHHDTRILQLSPGMDRSGDAAE